MRERPSPPTTDAANTVLVLSQEGVITQCIEKGALLDACALDFDTQTGIDLADLLPVEQVDIVRNHLRRAIRGRLSFCERVRIAARDATFEFMYVPQGRDKVLLVARDLAHLLGDLHHVRRLAFQDKATGLPNRQFLTDDLDDALQRQTLREGRLAVLSIHVGQIDDYGYGMSGTRLDDVLKQLATRLTLQIRGSNEPLHTDLERVSVVARTDYRQFAVMLPSIEVGYDAESVAARLVDVLSEPIMNDSGHIYVSPRIGVALHPQDGGDADTLLSNAEAAMDDARHARSACYRMHSGTIRLRALQRQDLAAELRTALQRNDYALKYLPIVDANNGDIQSMEALLRWPTALLTAQPIQKILTVAERTGIVADIGDWVMSQALQDFARWRAVGDPCLRLAINLTAPEFVRIDLVERLAELLQHNEVAAGLINVEIGEHILVRDAQSNFASCKRLQKLGVSVVVEDFGAGACSPAMLAESPVSAIKLDRRLVNRSTESETQRAACAAIVAAGHELNIKVTAVGIEQHAHAALMRQTQVDALQGFLFTEPLKSEAVADYLDQTVRALPALSATAGDVQ